MTTTNSQQVAEILARGVARVKARSIAQRDPMADKQYDANDNGSVESKHDANEGEVSQ